MTFILARNGEARGTTDSPDTPDGGQSSSCWWATMGCFGSASSKQADSNSSDDSKSQKRRSDAITKQLQKDKQVRPFFVLFKLMEIEQLLTFYQTKLLTK